MRTSGSPTLGTPTSIVDRGKGSDKKKLSVNRGKTKPFPRYRTVFAATHNPQEANASSVKKKTPPPEQQGRRFNLWSQKTLSQQRIRNNRQD
jgi:hypothetical protein